jgi:hypothetical protein
MSDLPNVGFPLSTSVLRRISAQNLHPIETDGTRPLRHASAAALLKHGNRDGSRGHQPMAMSSASSAVLPADSASANHRGLRPRPDQVSAGFSGWRYFAGTGARAVFVSVPTSSASD